MDKEIREKMNYLLTELISVGVNEEEKEYNRRNITKYSDSDVIESLILHTNICNNDNTNN